MMTLPLLDGAVVQNVTPAALSVPEAAAPSAADVDKFQAAFSPPRVVMKDIDAATPIDPAVITPGGLGDRMLATVERMRVGYNDGLVRVDAAMHKDHMKLPDVMGVFVDTLKMSMQQDMLSKVVGRTTQNLDTLLKGQ